jgi:enoyl-CoA hydratase/3-hydroxyacyl-CoA dehydrogenase
MDAESVERVAVVGAGATGQGVATVMTLGGLKVALWGLTAADADRGHEQVARQLNRLVDRGRLREPGVRRALERIEPHADLVPAVGEADLVVEAVPDRRSVRQDVYDSLAGLPPESTVLVTTAPGALVAEAAALGDRPDRTCGLRTFAPVVGRRVVEIVGAADTAPATLDLVAGVAERLGREPLQLPDDPPGGVVDRLLAPAVNEAAWLVTEGATPAAVDASARATGLGVGLLALADRGGLDRYLSVLELLADDVGKRYNPAPALRNRVDERRLGVKTGGGFHDGDPPTADGTDAWGRRLVAVLARETAALDAVGTADPATVDRTVGLATDLSRPPARLADEAGLDSLVAVLDDAREATDHPRYEATKSLRDRVATDRPFYAPEGPPPTGVRAERLPDAPGVARVVLDRPGRANALDAGAVRSLARQVEAFADDDEIRAVVLTGADGTFCVGIDHDATRLSTRDREGAADLARAGQRALGRMATADVPVVAAVDGACLGAGLTLAACADLRVATDRATFGHPARNLGLAPAWGGSARLPAVLGGSRAREILLTGEPCDAVDLHTDGFLVDVVGGASALARRARALAVDLAEASPAALSAVRRSLEVGREPSPGELEAEAEAFGRLAVTDEARAALRTARR